MKDLKPANQRDYTVTLSEIAWIGTQKWPYSVLAVSRKPLNTAPDDPAGANSIQVRWVSRPLFLFTMSKHGFEGPRGTPFGFCGGCICRRFISALAMSKSVACCPSRCRLCQCGSPAVHPADPGHLGARRRRPIRARACGNQPRRLRHRALPLVSSGVAGRCLRPGQGRGHVPLRAQLPRRARSRQFAGNGLARSGETPAHKLCSREGNLWRLSLFPPCTLITPPGSPHWDSERRGTAWG